LNISKVPLIYSIFSCFLFVKPIIILPSDSFKNNIFSDVVFVPGNDAEHAFHDSVGQVVGFNADINQAVVGVLLDALRLSGLRGDAGYETKSILLPFRGNTAFPNFGRVRRPRRNLE